jgi:hypothetical protein
MKQTFDLICTHCFKMAEGMVHNDQFDDLGLFIHYLKSISYLMQFEDLKRKSEIKRFKLV